MNEHKIKVGSEWVDKDGNKFTVLYSDDEVQLIKFDSGLYGTRVGNFDKLGYKPAPVRRTVWLNVYNSQVRAHETKSEADRNKTVDCLYQQEVELIDPCEGDKK